MRRIFFGSILLLGFFFILRRFTELQMLLDTFQKGDWRFLLIAVIVQLMWLFNVAAVYRVIFRAVEVKESIWRLVLMSTAATATNIVAPSAGAGGIAIFISEAQRQKYSPARVTVASLLYLLLDYVAFLVVLSVGILIYLQQNPFHPALIIAIAVLVVLTAALAVFLFLGLKSAPRFGKLLVWIVRKINAVLKVFLRREVLSEKSAWVLAHDTSKGLALLRQNPRSLWWAQVLLLNKFFLMMIVLGLISLAFQLSLSVDAVIAAFSIAYVFFIVSPTPAGLGFVEGALALVISSYQVSVTTATVVALVYRGITLWLPLIVGLLATQLLEAMPPVKIESRGKIPLKLP